MQLGGHKGAVLQSNIIFVVLLCSLFLLLILFICLMARTFFAKYIKNCLLPKNRNSAASNLRIFRATQLRHNWLLLAAPVRLTRGN